MANAQGYGIKLIVSFHSYNALSLNRDFYGKYYGKTAALRDYTKTADLISSPDIGTGNFYSDPQAITYFKNRVAHVMSHVNPNNGKTWAESSEYIFAFETQNEADHDQKNTDAMTAWQCDIAGAIKENLNGSTDILTTTGGASYLQPSVQDAYLSCDALDAIAIHAYGLGDLTTDALAPYVEKAVNAGKKLYVQEWGICYWDSSNNNCPKSGVLDSDTRDGEISTYFNNIAQAGEL